jgi:hypothetical protein
MLKDRSNFAERLQHNFERCFVWEDRNILGCRGVWLDRRNCGCYLSGGPWLLIVGDHFCSEEHRLGFGKYLWGEDWQEPATFTT